MRFAAILVIEMGEASHEYHARVDWTYNKEGNLIVDGKPETKISAPPEFGGPEGIISPEDLFVGAAAACFMTTFVTFKEKMRFDFKSFTCKGKGILERVERGFQFTGIRLTTTLTVESEDLVPKAERALELAERYCLVSNSMKCPTEHENHVVVG